MIGGRLSEPCGKTTTTVLNDQTRKYNAISNAAMRRVMCLLSPTLVRIDYVRNRTILLAFWLIVQRPKMVYRPSLYK
jgi:hypothetical protein